MTHLLFTRPFPMLFPASIQLSVRLIAFSFKLPPTPANLTLTVYSYHLGDLGGYVDIFNMYSWLQAQGQSITLFSSWIIQNRTHSLWSAPPHLPGVGSMDGWRCSLPSSLGAGWSFAVFHHWLLSREMTNSKLTQEEIESLNRSITFKGIDPVV